MIPAIRELVAWLPSWWPISAGASTSLVKLAVAAILGVAIGLERELKHRPTGLRTVMFICFGSAMFTILSDRLAGPATADHTRIAAQIITGIGFIGGGAILHDKGSVSGLTSAATIFVAAGIGMAAGGGLYQTAFFSTILVIICLLLLGAVETRFNLKPIIVSYDVITRTCESSDPVVGELNHVLETAGLSMQTVHMDKTADSHCRVRFTVEAFRSQQESLAKRIKDLSQVMTMAHSTIAERD
jgi:putative Mg2+ transporter-C (MgtC) family protein